MPMEYEWDSSKAKSNLQKHGIRYENGDEIIRIISARRLTVKRGAVMSIVKHKRGSAGEVSLRRETELKTLAEKPDHGIDYSDIPATDDVHWSEAVRGKFYRPLKTQASVRIDADVMEWLKRPGKGYQTRLNAILREAMLRDRNKK